MRVVVEADGGSRGNPGPAGYGTVVRDPTSGEPLAERAEAIGRETNNVAEYRGLIAGLTAAAEVGATHVDVRLDSKLLVEQMSGRWKVKNLAMQVLARQAMGLVRDFDAVCFTWVPRAQNGHADRLANEAMDAAADGREWELSPVDSPAEPAAGPVGSSGPADLRRVDESVARSLTAYGSVAVKFAGLARGQHVAVGVMHVAAGGVVGRHPTASGQLVLVTAGSGWVSGGDEQRLAVAVGDAVFWPAGTEHESGSDDGMTLVVVESDGLRESDLIAPGR